jgi:hypothetical protein
VEEIEKGIADMATKFTITANANVEDFLGVNISTNKSQGTMEFTQPQLIKSILEDLNLQSTSMTCRTPAVGNQVLHAHNNNKAHDEKWHCRSVIGKLNY